MDHIRELLNSVKDWREYVGYAGGLLYAARVLVQYIATEKRKAVTVPMMFWYLSIIASVVTVVYGVLIGRLAVVAQNVPNLAIYFRSLHIQRQQMKREAASA